MLVSKLKNVSNCLSLTLSRAESMTIHSYVYTFVCFVFPVVTRPVAINTFPLSK